MRTEIIIRATRTQNVLGTSVLMCILSLDLVLRDQPVLISWPGLCDCEDCASSIAIRWCYIMMHERLSLQPRRLVFMIGIVTAGFACILSRFSRAIRDFMDLMQILSFRANAPSGDFKRLESLERSSRPLHYAASSCSSSAKCGQHMSNMGGGSHRQAVTGGLLRHACPSETCPGLIWKYEQIHTHFEERAHACVGGVGGTWVLRGRNNGTQLFSRHGQLRCWRRGAEMRLFIDLTLCCKIVSCLLLHMNNQQFLAHQSTAMQSERDICWASVNCWPLLFLDHASSLWACKLALLWRGSIGLEKCSLIDIVDVHLAFRVAALVPWCPKGLTKLSTVFFMNSAATVWPGAVLRAG